MFGPKCTLCKHRYKKEEAATLRYTADGQSYEMEVCQSCADILDKVADASIQKRKSEHGNEPI